MIIIVSTLLNIIFEGYRLLSQFIKPLYLIHVLVGRQELPVDRHHRQEDHLPDEPRLQVPNQAGGSRGEVH